MVTMARGSDRKDDGLALLHVWEKESVMVALVADKRQWNGGG